MRVSNNMTLTKEQQIEAENDFNKKLAKQEALVHWKTVAEEITSEMIKHGEYPKSTGTKKEGTYKGVTDDNGQIVMIKSHKLDAEKFIKRLNETEPEYEFKFHWQSGIYLEMNDRN